MHLQVILILKIISTYNAIVFFIFIFYFYSFKTKGNLTKHMKSKAHFKKGAEQDQSPMSVDDIKQLDSEDMEDYSEDNMDEDDYIDDEDDDEEAVDKLGWRKTQSDFDAARSLLKLSQVFPSQIPQSHHAKAGILPYDHRPVSYPYPSEPEIQNNHQNQKQISPPVQINTPVQSGMCVDVPPITSVSVLNNSETIKKTSADLKHNVNAILNSSPKPTVNKPMDLSRFASSKELEQTNKPQVVIPSPKKPKALFRQPTTNGPSQKYTR